MQKVRRIIGLVLAGLLVATLAACGDDASSGAGAGEASGAGNSGGGGGGGGAFPVTIEHAFGETEIPAEPERVVTWGWASTDAAIALGVVPVAIPFEEYGGDEAGVLPWVREALEELGAEVPEVLPNTDEVPVEAIAAARPDLILAPYSGITEEEYELLSGIAPTVAYPGEPWATPWRQVIEIAGEALGRTEEAAALVADIEAEVAAAAEAHPELAGKSVALVWDTGDTFYVYKEADARAEFLLDLGMVTAESVRALATDESTFYFTLSKERLGELESDVLVSFADTEEAQEAFLTSDAARLMPQVREGRVATVTGEELIAAVSPPTALSLTWGLDAYLDALVAAVR